MDFCGGKKLFGNHAGTRGGAIGTAGEDSILAAARAAGNFSDGRNKFFAQLGGLRLHGVFHGRFEVEKFQPGAIRVFICRALRRDGSNHGAELLALGQNPRTSRPRRIGLHVKRGEFDFERADEGSFLAVLRLHVSCDSRPVRRARAILGDSDRNPAAPCFRPGHWPRQLARQHRRICRAVYRRLA